MTNMTCNDLWIYEASPIDHYKRWEPICASHFWSDEENLDPLGRPDPSALERTIIHGLTRLGNRIAGDYRGERMQCTFVDDEPIVCIKLDNNGTMLAWTEHLVSADDIPHDYDNDWTLTGHWTKGHWIPIRDVDIIQGKRLNYTKEIADLQVFIEMMKQRLDCLYKEVCKDK